MNTIIVVTAQDQEEANTLAKQADHVGGDLTFTVELSNDGMEPATHYWCCWKVTTEEWEYLTFAFGEGNTKGRRMYDADIIAPDEVLTELGLKRIITIPPRGQ